MAALRRMGELIIRQVLRLALRLVPYILWLVRQVVFIILTYWASLSIGLPAAAGRMAEAWYGGLPIWVIATPLGNRLHGLYTILAWAILLTGMVLQAFLIAWLLSLLL